MILTIANDALYKIVGEEESYRLIKEAGFDGVDLQCIDKKDSDILLNHHREEAEKTRKLLEKYGLICNLAHAPFRKMFYGMNFDLSEPIYKEVVNSIEYAAIVGAKMIAIHGIRTPLGPQSRQSLEYNCELFRSLAPYAKQFGIKLAIENVFGSLSDSLQMGETMRMLDDPTFTVLCDIGHLIEPQKFIRDLSHGSIGALHTHDMHGTPGKNDHTLPGHGIIDWEDTLKALAEVEYDGDLNYEIHGFLKHFDEETLPIALKLAERVGRSFIRKIEAFRENN